jgi:hypothetical protein
MTDIYDEYPGKTVVWIRWNPCGYKPPIGVTKIKTIEKRLQSLVDTINLARVSKYDTTMHVIYMFYSFGNQNITKNIKSEMIYS